MWPGTEAGTGRRPREESQRHRAEGGGLRRGLCCRGTRPVAERDAGYRRAAPLQRRSQPADKKTTRSTAAAPARHAPLPHAAWGRWQPMLGGRRQRGHPCPFARAQPRARRRHSLRTLPAGRPRTAPRRKTPSTRPDRVGQRAMRKKGRRGTPSPRCPDRAMMARAPRRSGHARSTTSPTCGQAPGAHGPTIIRHL